MKNRLFAVCLGGSAPRSNTELHDVVFAIGADIEATYEALMDKWFGTPKGLHLDSYMELDVVDGHSISLTREKPKGDKKGDKKLFFVNLGAYRDGVFGEFHAMKFIVTTDKAEAKKRGKAELMQNWGSPVHTDNLFEVDDCLEVGQVGDFYVSLEPTGAAEDLKPVNGYHLIPKDIVTDYLKRKPERAG
jgi:hypothetical protein